MNLRLAIPRSRRGSVIVVVLALVMLAAFFLSRFIERVATELLVETRARHAQYLRREAFSALEAALAVLADYQAEDGGLRTPAQGWGDPLAAADYVAAEGVRVTVAVDDESGKPSLSRLGARQLELLGRQLGLQDADAARFADALLAWTRADHPAAEFANDPRQYERADPPHRAPGRALESFAELAAIAGVRDLFYDAAGQPSELLGRLQERVSLHDFPALNLNAAGTGALALAGLDPAQAGRIRDVAATRGFRDVAEARALLGTTAPLAGCDTTVHGLRLHVTAQEGTSILRLDVVVAPRAAAPDPKNSPPTKTPAGAGSLQYPFVVLELAETVELQPPTS